MSTIILCVFGLLVLLVLVAFIFVILVVVLMSQTNTLLNEEELEEVSKSEDFDDKVACP